MACVCLECSYLQGLIKITDALLQSSGGQSVGKENAHPAPARDAFHPHLLARGQGLSLQSPDNEL